MGSDSGKIEERKSSTGVRRHRSVRLPQGRTVGRRARRERARRRVVAAVGKPGEGRGAGRELRC